MRCGLVDVPGWFSVVTLPCSQITHYPHIASSSARSALHRTSPIHSRAVERAQKSAAPGALSLIRNPFHVLIGLRTMRNTVIA